MQLAGRWVTKRKVNERCVSQVLVLFHHKPPEQMVVKSNAEVMLSSKIMTKAVSCCLIVGESLLESEQHLSFCFDDGISQWALWAPNKFLFYN